MRTERIWLGVLTALVLGGIIAGSVTVATLRADLAALDRQLAGEIGTDNAGGEIPRPTSPPAGQPTGRIDALVVTSDTLSITLSVRLSGPADLLFEPPRLEGERASYHPTPESLEQARFDFLDLASHGQARATLAFRPAPEGSEGLTLIFNPNHSPGEPVAPRWALPVRSGR